MDAFGEVRTKTGPLSTSFLFTGEQFDAKARLSQGLYYLRARYYDPSIGRFLTQDPLWGSTRVPQSQSRYPYVLNNPANLVDPAGFQAQEAVGTGVVICGAGGAACAVAVVVAAGVYVCVAGACEALGEVGGALIEGARDVAGDFGEMLFGKKKPRPVRIIYTDEDPVDVFAPGPGGWWPPGFPNNLPPWMRTALRVTGVGTIVGIILDQVDNLFAPTLPGEKPPASPYHSP